jgi:ATP-dependent Clp protease ATP-binding subunit ClpA
LKGKAIVSLDLASMLAGTKFRGEFEDRLKGCLKEIEQAGDKVILFIDELHVIVGAGGSEGGIDASNILKPSLARGLLRCLGTTTIDEYKKHIEKDSALARRFQSVYVPEPTSQDTIHILEGLKWKYEQHHSIDISADAIRAAVELSGKYMPARKFPDKAIDLIDQAAAKLRTTMQSKPSRLLQIGMQIDKYYIHNLLIYLIILLIWAAVGWGLSVLELPAESLIYINFIMQIFSPISSSVLHLQKTRIFAQLQV